MTKRNSFLKSEADALHKTGKLTIKAGREFSPMFIIVFKKKMSEFLGEKAKTPTDRALFMLDFGPDNKEKMAAQIANVVDKYRSQIKCVAFAADAWYSKYNKEPRDMSKITPPGEDPNRKEMLLTMASTPEMDNIYGVGQSYHRDGGKIIFHKKSHFDKDSSEYATLERMMGYYGN